jgi:hypothetical protein
MRITLLEAYRDLKAAGLTIYGIHTDCFIVSAAKPTKFAEFYRTNYQPLLIQACETKEREAQIAASSKRLLSSPEFKEFGALPAGLRLVEGKSVENLGKFKREPVPKVASTRLYDVKDNSDQHPQWLRSASCRHPSDWIAVQRMMDESRQVHFVEKFAYHNDPICDGTLVLAKCAGAGKTTACLANCVGKVLVVLPTTKRVASVRRQWKEGEFPAAVSSVTAMTSARFVGRQVRQDRGKAHLPPIDEYDTIVVDELYLNSIADIISIVKRLEALRESQHRNYKKEWKNEEELDAVRYSYYKTLVLEGIHSPEWEDRKKELERTLPKELVPFLDKEQELVIRCFG